MTIRIETGIEELLKTLDPEVIRKANKAAVRRIQRKMATVISGGVRETYNITARDIASAVKMQLQDGGRTAIITYRGRRRGLINYGGAGVVPRVMTARGVRFGAKAKLYKKKPRALVKGGFVARGRNGNVHIFRRSEQNQSNSTLEAITAPAVAQMVKNQGVEARAQKTLNQQWPIELAHQITFFFNKTL